MKVVVSSTPEATRPTPAPGRWAFGARWRGVAHRLCAGVAAEWAAQGPRLALWRPVAFGAGAACYFGLKSEPAIWIGAAAAMGAIGACVAGRLWRWPSIVTGVLFLALLACAGFGAANLRTRLASAPVVPGDIGVVTIEGEVVDIRSPSSERWRLLIAPSRVGDLSTADMPARIRIVSAVGDRAAPGDRVRVTAILNPPPGPSSPGAYDFARDAYFERIGAVGAALTPVTIEAGADRIGGIEGMEIALNGWRWELALRLTEDLQQLRGEWPSNGLVAVLATSHEAWLPKESEDDLRGSGLAHMLAIAGLHMAAVSGFVFWGLRVLIAACPPLALRLPGKKLAAAGGLLAVLVYLALSGAHPPARRAAITASVAFMAILTHRQAVSLHALSIAALIVLVLEPECVVQPGFQMSFCATGALVALAEVWRPERGRALNTPWLLTLLDRAREAVIGLITVSTVAGLATAPFSMQHFNRTAIYGAPANLLADLLASAVVMPAVAIAAMGEACSLHHLLIAPALWVAGLGSAGILAVGHLFANLPGAGLTNASAPFPALLVSFCGLIFAILWHGRFRWVGAVAGLAVLGWPRPPDPLAWLGPDGANAAIVERRTVQAMRPDRRRFALESFAQHRGLILPPPPGEDEPDGRFDCRRDYCIDQSHAAPRIANWFTRRKPSAATLKMLCASDILLLTAPVNAPADCTRPLILRPATFQQFGAAEVVKTHEGWRLEWSSTQRGARPWSTPARFGARSGGDVPAPSRTGPSDSGG